MTRKVRDSSLETATARQKLKARRKPYYRLIEPGLHLGYRRLASGPGTWVIRRYVGSQSYLVKNLTTDDRKPIFADDNSPADGRTVLTFGQAQEKAKEVRPTSIEGHYGPYTVSNAMADYIADREAHGKNVRDAKSHNKAFIEPQLGSIEVVALKTLRIKKWHQDLAKQRRLKTGRAKDGPQFSATPLRDDDESVRRRQATANRILTTLKAALNQVARDKKLPDIEWRYVKPFEDVDAARLRYLTIAESKRLINACSKAFRSMVHAALLTGARYGQLARLTVADFNPDSGTLQTKTRKGRGKIKHYHIVLTDEGVRFFARACAGLATDALIFRKPDGELWGASDQDRPMKQACKAATLKPAIGFHGLRHTWASHAVMNGVPLLVVAKNLGHSDTRMVEKHYGHLAPDWVANAIRCGAPKFGIKTDKIVLQLAR